jgi:hypothetical protein
VADALGVPLNTEAEFEVVALDCLDQIVMARSCADPQCSWIVDTLVVRRIGRDVIAKNLC